MIKLFEPSGMIKENPDCEYLKNIIYNSDNDFWNSSDDMNLTFESSDGIARLILVHSDENFFYLEYAPADLKGFDTFVSFNESIQTGNSISVYVGGEEHLLPVETFINSDKAYDAIKQFIQDGNKTQKVTWVKRSQLKWPQFDE